MVPQKNRHVITEYLTLWQMTKITISLTPEYFKHPTVLGLGLGLRLGLGIRIIRELG